MNGYARAGFQYENYDDINVLSASLGWKKIGPVTGVINLVKPYNSDDNRAVVVADLFYSTGKFYDLNVKIKRVYDNADTFTESVSVGVTFSPERLIPGLPL